MKQQVIGEICESLSRMENAGKVDVSILGSLDKLRQAVRKNQAKWLEHTNTDAYYFYHATKDMELVLDRMEQRFKDSQGACDNPKVARDSLAVMTIMDDVLHMVETGDASRPVPDEVLNRTLDLEDTAERLDMIRQLEGDEAIVDKDMERRVYEEMARALEAEICGK